MPDLQPVNSNTDAIIEARDTETKAAIASEEAAKLYGVDVLRSNIEDFVANATRFLVIGDAAVGSSGQDKTSILMSKKSEPGSLLKLLETVCPSRNQHDDDRIPSEPERGIGSTCFLSILTDTPDDAAGRRVV